MSPVILATRVGPATGSRAAAAALACAGSEPDRASLLIDLAAGRWPRPSLLATSAAHELEDRLAVHLPGAGVASRGQICHLSLAAGSQGIEDLAGALSMVSGTVAVVHMPPNLLQPVLEETRTRASGALLRADLGQDRALTALAIGDLMQAGLRVAVLKRPLGWIASMSAAAGLRLPAAAGLPPRLCDRLLRRLERSPAD